MLSNVTVAYVKSICEGDFLDLRSATTGYLKTKNYPLYDEITCSQIVHVNPGQRLYFSFLDQKWVIHKHVELFDYFSGICQVLLLGIGEIFYVFLILELDRDMLWYSEIDNSNFVRCQSDQNIVCQFRGFVELVYF